MVSLVGVHSRKSSRRLTALRSLRWTSQMPSLTLRHHGGGDASRPGLAFGLAIYLLRGQRGDGTPVPGCVHAIAD